MQGTVLIVGCGNIGKHMYAELLSLRPLTYDAFIESTPNRTDISTKVDVAFVCVPTEKREDGSADTSIVEEVVGKVNANIVVIKSTIPPGTTEMLAEKYSKNLVFSPEYYGTTQHADESPNFLVLGGNRAHCIKVAQLFYRVKNGSFRIHFTDSRTAELAKYMENCFLALKVTFCAEFAAIAKSLGLSYEELREVFVLDPRMGHSHTIVYEDKPYYDSHCLNKDIPALISYIGKENVPLMSAINEINSNIKTT